MQRVQTAVNVALQTAQIEHLADLSKIRSTMGKPLPESKNLDVTREQVKEICVKMKREFDEAQKIIQRYAELFKQQQATIAQL
ncbi:hypothetical protein [Helicobacter salomonis]|uniref:hypothetical protein n=1 Tax=Helicobacter salomonis TaxID=56878 RepID=UPI000CF06898|nr:hypothetical protein [Helicobacter salomonis]